MLDWKNYCIFAVSNCCINIFKHVAFCMWVISQMVLWNQCVSLKRNLAELMIVYMEDVNLALQLKNTIHHREGSCLLNCPWVNTNLNLRDFFSGPDFWPHCGTLLITLWIRRGYPLQVQRSKGTEGRVFLLIFSNYVKWQNFVTDNFLMQENILYYWLVQKPRYTHQKTKVNRILMHQNGNTLVLLCFHQAVQFRSVWYRTLGNGPLITVMHFHWRLYHYLVVGVAWPH